MSHCPQCNKLMRGICRYCQPQEYIDMQGKAITELVNDMKPQRPATELRTVAPPHKWVGLTDEEKAELWEVSRAALPRYTTYASLVEAKLREKNSL